MDNTMKYKGYTGVVTYDDEAQIFHGEVVGIRDVITFQGKTVAQLRKAFRDSVDDYLAWCEELGEEPQKTFSGNIRIRISVDLHKQLAHSARVKGVSLNSLIAEKLRR